MDADAASTGRRAFALRLLSGPAAFAAGRAAAGLAPEAHFVLAAYAWVLAWWVATPVPWTVTSFLPFVVLPPGGAMPFADVAARYGHTRARRIALAVLCLPGVARSGGDLPARDHDRVRDVRGRQRPRGHRDDDPIGLSVARSAAPGAGRMAAAASLAVLQPVDPPAAGTAERLQLVAAT